MPMAPLKIPDKKFIKIMERVLPKENQIDLIQLLISTKVGVSSLKFKIKVLFRSCQTKSPSTK